MNRVIMITMMLLLQSIVNEPPCRLELIDDAMLRPGRLGKLLYVPLPNVPDRVAILTALIR